MSTVLAPVSGTKSAPQKEKGGGVFSVPKVGQVFENINFTTIRQLKGGRKEVSAGFDLPCGKRIELRISYDMFIVKNQIKLNVPYRVKVIGCMFNIASGTYRVFEVQVID